MNIEKKEWKKPEVKEFLVKEETEGNHQYGFDAGVYANSAS